MTPIELALPIMAAITALLSLCMSVALTIILVRREFRKEPESVIPQIPRTNVSVEMPEVSPCRQPCKCDHVSVIGVTAVDREIITEYQCKACARKFSLHTINEQL